MGTVTSSEEATESSTIQNEIAKMLDPPQIKASEDFEVVNNKPEPNKSILKEHNIKQPPPLPKKNRRNLKELLENEIGDGIDSLGDKELAAWICRANSVLDNEIVQRARRIFAKRLKEQEVPPAMIPKLSPTAQCPKTVSMESFELFANSAELRRPPRVNVEYWASAPNAPWRDGLSKQAITKQITIKKEIDHKAKAEERDSVSVSAGTHIQKLHGFGVSISWLLAFTFALDLWEWATWEVQLLIVKSATEFRGRCRFAELPEVKPHTGPANVYVCHCWGGKWGDLVAAVSTNCRDDRFVWIDIFAVRQWPGNSADFNFRETIKLCESLIVVIPHQVLSINASCENNHTLLPMKKTKKELKGHIQFSASTKDVLKPDKDYDNEDQDNEIQQPLSKIEHKIKQKIDPNKVLRPKVHYGDQVDLNQSEVSEVKIIDQDISNYDESREGASSGGGAAVKRDSISSLAESIASVVSTLSGVGADSDGGGGGGGQDPNKPICVSCGSDVVTLVCRECSYFICDNCNKKVNTESSTDWFLRDEGLKRCFMETEQWSNLVEKQPTLRLWCLVEMQAAIKYKKAIILKVGEHVLSDMPSEHEKPATPTRLKKKNKKVSSRKLKSAAALEALDTEKKRLPRPFSGKVTFQPPSRQALSIFLLNLSSIINHSEAAFSLPDDLEREMLLLGNETLTIDEAISTVVTSSAFEYISPEVEAYLCGEREALRCLPQSKVYAAFDSAASGGRIDVMCELLASRPQNVGDLSYHLNRCAMKGRLGSMLFLLNYGADVNAPSYGRTPLTNAVENGQVDAVAMLLDKGADVNTDAGGRGTALWWAATSNNPTLVQMLLDAGADPELASLGQTPLMVAAAAAGDSDEVVTMLKLATQ